MADEKTTQETKKETQENKKEGIFAKLRGKLTGFKNEEKLKEFKKALPSIFAMSDTKNVVNAASDGDLADYEKKIKEFKVKGTRDYNMALIILSPIVVAARAILKNAELEDKANGKEKGYLDQTHVYLKNLLDNVMKDPKLKELLTAIGAPSNGNIKAVLKRFTTYQTLLLNLSGGKYGHADDDFTKRAKNMTGWIVNKKYVNDKLLKFVNETLSSDLTSKLKAGLARNVDDDETEENKKLPFNLSERWNSNSRQEEEKYAKALDEALRNNDFEKAIIAASNLDYKNLDPFVGLVEKLKLDKVDKLASYLQTPNHKSFNFPDSNIEVTGPMLKDLAELAKKYKFDNGDEFDTAIDEEKELVFFPLSILVNASNYVRKGEFNLTESRAEYFKLVKEFAKKYHLDYMLSNLKIFENAELDIDKKDIDILTKWFDKLGVKNLKVEAKMTTHKLMQLRSDLVKSPGFREVAKSEDKGQKEEAAAMMKIFNKYLNQ